MLVVVNPTHGHSGICTFLLHLIVGVYFLAQTAHESHCALLTNIYGKKLSEITEIDHRYLLLPLSPAHHQAQSKPGDGGLEQEAQIGDKENRNNNDISQQQQRRAHNNNNNNNRSRSARSLATPTSLPRRNDTSPLVASWRQQQQQQQQQLAAGSQLVRSGRLMAQGAQSGNQNGTTFVPFYEKDPNTLSQRGPPVEPPAQVESLTTDFPNPNINNLGHEITKILRKFFQHGYDKRVRPNYSGPPALVNVSFHIIGISSVDEVQMDFTTDFYFRQKWFDPRLEFDAVGEIDELCVGAEFAERIWLPDTFFANEKTATFHKATTENTFIRIGQNGRVYRSIRLTVTCSCPMDLQYFPMDRQRCKIEIESYGYNTRDIDYRWERGDASVSLNTKIELPQFKILGFKMGQEIQNLSSGDYIRLYCEIHFVRSMGYYLFQIYIPASLIVMISWVSFWLHRNATPARVALGVTTVLTMTTLMSSTNAALPKISYIKSIDVFLGTCFVMVFAALLEYASVGYIGKRIAMKRKRLQDLQQMQAHHQKVCVAAAASAAAAAAAANAANTPGSGGGGNGLHKQSPNEATVSQTLHRRSVGGLMKNLMNMDQGSGSKTLQGRASLASVSGSHRGINDHSGDLGAQFGDEPTNRRTNPNPNPMSPLLTPGINGDPNSRAPLLAAGAAIAAAAAAANQHSHGSTTEFEVNQTHDMIRIYGLTPSAIDKHSRMVFPICFVCFNLMYWIIYGHISQQIEDKGPPLIPFIKN